MDRSVDGLLQQGLHLARVTRPGKRLQGYPGAHFQRKSEELLGAPVHNTQQPRRTQNDMKKNIAVHQGYVTLLHFTQNFFGTPGLHQFPFQLDGTRVKHILFLIEIHIFPV